jgi:hypothetical protein
MGDGSTSENTIIAINDTGDAWNDERSHFAFHTIRRHNSYMSVDPHSISLTDDQRRALADLADQSGRPWPELLAEAIASYRPKAAANGKTPESFSAAAERLGLLGCVEGPADLSTNPAHMEGFGQRGN